MLQVSPHPSGWPKITVVTPSYNQGRFLGDTIRSVLAQNYPDLEYIIMDGGSSDDSVGIIRQHAGRLAHWESHPDAGQADAVYRGFLRSSGDILCYLNSDDFFLPGCLETVGRYFMAHPEEEWGVGGTLHVGPDGRPLRNRIAGPVYHSGVRVSFNQLLFFGCAFNQPAVFWRREPFFATGGFERSLQFCFDYDLFFRLARRRPSGRIQALLAGFRTHPDSKSGTIRDVCAAENEALWVKYGRYEHSLARRRLAAAGYALAARLRFRLAQFKLWRGRLGDPETGVRPAGWRCLPDVPAEGGGDR